MRDTWLIFRHHTRITLRNKFAILITAAQPLFFLVLFGPIFATFGSWETLVPGLIIQLGLLSAGMAGFGVVFDWRSGVLERLRVTPAGRLPLLLGRVLNNTFTLVVQTVLLVAVAYLIGLRAPLLGVLGAMALVVVLGVSLAALSHAAAMRLNEHLFAPVMMTAVWPLMLLSGTFLPMSMAPQWLSTLSYVSPFRYVLEAMRELFAGTYASGVVAVGVLVVALFAAISLTVGTRVFSRDNA
ncbi:ABC transporter permease [Nonomuraea dietziae]|uniref:Transport permease protein n=1 Tax=Nonomuraea dietziae TaxID=65515 RepID=A0A7W5UWN5_9ACTN|nr:ABC transporter permease [Nonomuraea dietziae]MBB3726106.1 ABC-2 type transport system permease protein [Nonomuraea dietziae]